MEKRDIVGTGRQSGGMLGQQGEIEREGSEANLSFIRLLAVNAPSHPKVFTPNEMGQPTGVANE